MSRRKFLFTKWIVKLLNLHPQVVTMTVDLERFKRVFDILMKERLPMTITGMAVTPVSVISIRGI